MEHVDLSEVLRVCVRGCLAAQRYIALDLLQLPKLQVPKAAPGATILDLNEPEKQQLMTSLRASIQVDVKSVLDYKDGSAEADLVTTADVTMQAVLVELLARHFPTTPFSIIGEEESPNASINDRAAQCLSTYYDPDAAIPAEEAFTDYLARPQRHVTLTAPTIEELRGRVQIYIDPIDGTNCFVDGVWEAPMTLIGITVDGVPVAAVTNRIFVYRIEDAATAGPFLDSVSYVWNADRAAGEGALPFLVHEGRHIDVSVLTPPPSCTASTPLLVSKSSTTKESYLSDILHMLGPMTPINGRGAGNKLFYLVDMMLQQPKVPPAVVAHVFVCLGNTIKKWDCCAPHSFLLALGGDVYTRNGAPLRYPFPGTGSKEDFTNLPDDIIATTQQAEAEVARRMGWRPS